MASLARAKFNPNGYPSLEDSDSHRQLEIVQKGKNRELKFDTAEIDHVLADMRKHSHYYIRDLHGDLKRGYDMIVRLVDMLYESDGYSHLYNLVKKHFGDVDNAKPGTLCAYFAGCLINSNQGGGDCGVLCAGSLPLPRGVAKGKCGETVILCTYDSKNRRYHFKVLTSGTKSDAIIYMESGNPNTFKGFSKHEKGKLKGMGIDKISVNWVHHKSGSKIAPKVEIENLPDLEESHHGDEDDDSSSDLTALWVILVALGIVIVILFLANR